MLIVDANNVSHAAGDGRSPDAVVRLMEAILHSRYASGEVVLVCDGSPGRMSPGAQASMVRLLAGRSGIRVVYAGPEQEADDVIERMLGDAPVGARIVVVSSDARLALAAHRVGAAALRAAEFLDYLNKDRVKVAARQIAADEGLDSGSVAWWMDYFGLDERGNKRSPRPRTLPPNVTSDPEPASPRKKRTAAPEPSSGDWLSEIRRMWPGLSEGELDMERILKDHGPAKKRRKRHD